MSSPSRVVTQPTWLLSRANTRAQALLHAAFADAGVRGYHYRLLAALEEHGPCSQADLGRSTGIDRSDVVAALDDLAGWGFAQRDPDPTDRRRNIVSLTDAGLVRLDELAGVVEGVQAAVLEPLSEAERATLARLLAKLG